MPDRDAELTIIHRGGDGWGPEYVRIILDDGTWFECPNEDGLFVDNFEFIELNCYANNTD